MSAPIYFVDSALHARVLKVQSEAKRLLSFKKSNGVLFNRVDALKAFAFIRSSAPSGWLKFNKKKAFKWWELDAVSLKDDARLAGIDAHDDEIDEALSQVVKWRARYGSRQIRGATLGRLLELCNDERAELRITAILSKDDTVESKHERRKDGWRTRKAAMRRADGRMPRAEYESESLSKTKPWLSEGISRATWYRRQAKAETSPSPPVYISNTEGDTPVSANSEPFGSGANLGLSDSNRREIWLGLEALKSQAELVAANVHDDRRRPLLFDCLMARFAEFEMMAADVFGEMR